MTNEAEATKVVETENDENSTNSQENTEQWVIYMDGASNENEFGSSRMLISLEGHKIHCALCFGFSASNNEV